MIQDIFPKVFHNGYREAAPQPESGVFLFRGREILVSKGSRIPEYGDLQGQLADRGELQFLFAIDEKTFFLMRQKESQSCLAEVDLPGYGFVDMVTLRTGCPRETVFAMATAYHLSQWYESNRFCGRCGAPMQPDHRERRMDCTSCKHMVYPKISPTVIVGVTDGDRILLTKYAGRAYTRYALIAGFMEIGETAEETVRREVLEEVGVRVKNIRYYKSQPWGYDSNLLLGFFAELDGSDEIVLDTDELALGEWVSREDIEEEDDGISLTREMMLAFKRGDIRPGGSCL